MADGVNTDAVSVVPVEPVTPVVPAQTEPAQTTPVVPDSQEKVVDTMTKEQLAAYIKDLRNENASKRIAAKKAKEAMDATLAQNNISVAELTETKAKLAAIEKEKLEKQLAEKTEIEQLTIRLDLQKAEAEKLAAQIETEKKEKAKLTKTIKVKDRKMSIEQMMLAEGQSFSSEFERAGFLNQFTAQKDGEFAATDEEIQLAIQTMAKTRNAAAIPTTPQNPSKTKGVAPPVKDELVALLAKSSKGALTPEENARFNEISTMI